MRHHGGGGAGGGGIEGLTPPTGPVASAFSIGAFLAAVWLVVKHPRIALNCAIAGGLLALVAPGDGTGVSHSVPMFALVLVLGALLSKGKSRWRERAPRPRKTVRQSVTLTHDRITPNHMLAYVNAKLTERNDA